MSLISFLLFCTFVVNLTIGILVFLKNIRKEANQAFALFAFGVAMWNLTIFLTINNFPTPLFWGRVAFSMGTVMATGFLWFIHVFPVRSKHALAWKVLSFLLMIFYGILPVTSFMIKSVSPADGYILGEFVIPVYLLWLVFFIAVLVYGMIFLWRSLAQTKGIVHHQLKPVVLGLVAYLVPFLITNLLLPIFANDFRWNGLGPLFTIFFVVSVAYSIIRYRFLEIRWVIKKSTDIVLYWLVAYLFIIGSNFLLYRSFSVSNLQIVTSFLFAVFFPPIIAKMSYFSARLASHGTYLFDTAVQAVLQLTQTSSGLEDLQKAVVEKLRKFFGFQKVAILTLGKTDASQTIFTYIEGFDKKLGKIIPKALRFCLEVDRDVVEADELRWALNNDIAPKKSACNKRMLRFMDTHGIEVIIPLLVGDEFVGLICLSDKKDKAGLRKRDIDLIRILQGATAPAFANAAKFEEVQQLYLQIREFDKSKNDFIDVVSHQFRTPLTAIQWNAEIITGLTSDAKILDANKDIGERAHYLAVTLDRIFDILSVENKTLKLRRQKFDLKTVLLKIKQDCDALSPQNNVQVFLKKTPIPLSTDPQKLETALCLILENAKRYSQAGSSIEIKAHVKNGSAIICIVDHGIGINPARLPHIFDKFFRAPNAVKFTPNGTGTGLYLAKQIIKRMRGKITVESELNKGTIFTVTLPLGKS